MKALSTLLFASSNRGKAAEVIAVGHEYEISILTADELARERGEPAPVVAENGSSYLENAESKAEAYFAWAGVPSLGDDTGLEVAALGNAPGLFSSRYAGPEQDPKANTEKLLAALAAVEDRRAVFRCVVMLRAENLSLSATGLLRGTIARARRGGGGFGYDNVFSVDGYDGATLAELKEQGISVATHRILACRELFAELRKKTQLD